MKNNLTIVATCTFGMEKVLKREVINLGYTIEKVEDGKIYYKGSMKDVAKSNLWLRCAGRVLIHVATFEAYSFDDLFDEIKEVPFEEFISKNAGFNVAKVSASKSKLFSKTDIQKIVKKAMVERLKNAYGVDKWEESREYYELRINVKKDVVNIYINTSGSGLHKRGYRENALKAPLKETLASGMIQLAGYRGDRPFSDVMCGSGTIIIEAAMIAKNIAPGINRDFAFAKWNKEYEDILLKEKEDAKNEIKECDIRLLGSDIDYRAIKIANENAKKAMVDDIVSFQKLDMREFRSKKKNGIMVVNPPYAQRIGEEEEVIKLYKDLADVYENLEEWRLFVLCAHPFFEKCFGKKADKNRKLFNGDMLCYLYQYYPPRRKNK